VSFAASAGETTVHAIPPARAEKSHAGRRAGPVVIKSETLTATLRAGQSLFDMTPKDALAGVQLPGELTQLPPKSRWLFHTCKWPSARLFAKADPSYVRPVVGRLLGPDTRDDR